MLQLIAETLVDFLNNEGASAVTPDLMERALDETSVGGQNVLNQLMRGECSVSGEWEYLSAFRRVEEQNAPRVEAIRESLLRRQLVLATGDGWRLRVPLMARWLRLRGRPCLNVSVSPANRMRIEITTPGAEPIPAAPR